MHRDQQLTCRLVRVQRCAEFLTLDAIGNELRPEPELLIEALSLVLLHFIVSTAESMWHRTPASCRAWRMRYGVRATWPAVSGPHVECPSRARSGNHSSRYSWTGSARHRWAYPSYPMYTRSCRRPSRRVTRVAADTLCSLLPCAAPSPYNFVPCRAVPGINDPDMSRFSCEKCP